VRAVNIGNKLLQVYPEYWQTYVVLSEMYDAQGDSAKSLEIYRLLHDTLTAFLESNPENLFYMQDLGMAKVEIGRRSGNQELVDEGVNFLWDSFAANANSNYAFRKLVASLSQIGRFPEIHQASLMFSEYKINRQDPFLQQILGLSSSESPIPQSGGE